MAAFSPDSAILALQVLDPNFGAAIALVELATGREVAQLQDPEGAKAAQIVFSPDGTQVIDTLVDQPEIRIWDLRAIRRKLAELGLDWDSPAPWDAGSTTIRHTSELQRRYRVNPGRLNEWVRQAPVKRREQAVADAEAYLRSHPDSPEIRKWSGQLCNALAWELIAGAEEHRDPTRALPLARRAVAQKPDDTTYLTTLGLASTAREGTARRFPYSSHLSPRAGTARPSTTCSSCPPAIRGIAT